jgi:hypothetical protein
MRRVDRFGRAQVDAHVGQWLLDARRGDDELDLPMLRRAQPEEVLAVHRHLEPERVDVEVLDRLEVAVEVGHDAHDRHGASVDRGGRGAS